MSIAIIGCGSSGSVIAEHLSKRGNTDQIKLFDVELERSKKVLNIIQSKNTKIDYSADEINATKSKEITKILDDVEVVINSASPKCNIPIMKSCLKSDTNYIDLASDPFGYSGSEETTFDAQLELTDDFADRSLLAVTNTGFSPGFTDLLSKYIIKKNSLDSVGYIKIYLGEKIKSEKFVVSWSPYTLLMESLLPPTVYKQNKITTLNFDKSYRRINFSSPINEIKLKIFNGHPELRTIPKYIDKQIDYIEIGGGFKLNDREYNEIIIEALQRQIEKSHILKGDVFENLSNSFEDLEKFRYFFQEGSIENEISECIFQIKGEKGEKTFKKEIRINHNLKEVSKNFSLGSITSFLVSFVPVIIAEKILSGDIKETGVIAPAGLDESEAIIRECEKAGLLKGSDLE